MNYKLRKPIFLPVYLKKRLSTCYEIKKEENLFVFRALFSNFAIKIAKLFHLGKKRNKFLLLCTRFFVTLPG